LSSQVIVSRYEAPEFPNPALESPDELVYVESDPGSLLRPILVTQVATPSSVGTTRIETVNKPTSKDLVEPFVTTAVPGRRRRKTFSTRLGQEIAHATPQEFMKAHKITTGFVRRTALQENLAQRINVAAYQDARARVGAVVPSMRMSWGMRSVVCTHKVLGHPSERSLYYILTDHCHAVSSKALITTRSPGAGFIGDPVQPLVRRYHLFRKTLVTSFSPSSVATAPKARDRRCSFSDFCEVTPHRTDQ